MKKFLKELKGYLFYGKLEGVIYNKRPYIECNLSVVLSNPNLTIVTLAKKVHFLGKERTIYKDIIVNNATISKFKIGEYYVYS